MNNADESAVRILDANLNRSREALRVIEDHARFALDDREAACATKHLRHDLRRIIGAVGADALLAARDIVSDVGRDVKTKSELTRRSSDDVVRAAFGRLSESMRVLGEYGKLISAEVAEIAESIRYRAYELEQRVVLRGDLRRRFKEVRLYVIVTEALCRGDWLKTADAAIRGGARCIQLREKDLPDAELLVRAKRLRELTRRREALLIMNDRPDIARLSGADGVHIGQSDLSVAEARRIAGGRVLVGKSTHTLEQFKSALDEKPDYLAVGPMFQSSTKPQDHIAGPETLAAARELTETPIVAIGGITPDNAGEILAAGANMVAVCSAVIGAMNAESAARSFAAVRR